MSAGFVVKPLAIDPCEAARRLGISEHELKALVDAEMVPCVWIGKHAVRFSIAAIEKMQDQALDVPKVVWKKPPMAYVPGDHPEVPFSRKDRTRARYVGNNTAWRKRVFERDEYQCRRCKCADPRVLTAHHVKPRNRNPGLAFDIENGLTLCENCHKIEHVINPVKPIRRKKHIRRDNDE